MSSNEPIKQHYIPQVYLRNFCNRKEKLCFFDTDKNEIHENMATNSVLFQKHFYTLEDENGNKDYQLEKWFSTIETEAKPIFNKIINKQSITMQEKEKLSLFLALLQNRTPIALDLQDSFMKPAMEWLNSMYLNNGVYDKLIEECPMGKTKGREYIENMDMSITKNAKWNVQIEQANTFAQYYTNMEWTLLYTQKGHFLTTDNPLIILSPSGNLGIAIPGNIKMIALSSNIVLQIRDVGTPEVYTKIINDKKHIRTINKLLYLNRNRFVISDDKGLLENMQKRYSDKKIKIGFTKTT